MQCSIKYLNFFQTPDERESKKVIELKNSSSVSATYQFDDNDDGLGIFQLDKYKGKIPANGYAYISVKFLPKTPGYYFRQLWCLVLHQVLNIIKKPRTINNISGTNSNKFVGSFLEKSFVRFFLYAFPILSFHSSRRIGGL